MHAPSAQVKCFTPNIQYIHANTKTHPPLLPHFRSAQHRIFFNPTELHATRASVHSRSLRKKPLALLRLPSLALPHPIRAIILLVISR